MIAYCINLDRRPDRLAHMVSECTKAGIAFERVAAVDGRDPSVAEDAAKVPQSHWGTQMSAPAFACLQSHREVWRRFLASGAGHAMVLEDDVLLAPGLGVYLQDNWVPDDADIVKLETFAVRVHLAKAALPIAGGRHLHRLQSGHVGTSCYVLSASTAARLLQMTGNTGDPVDEVMFNDELAFFASAVIYQMHPAPAIQGDRSTVKQGWTATDIITRSAQATAVGPAPETPAQRLRRRLVQEIRARWRGSRYVVVPHG